MATLTAYLTSGYRKPADLIGMKPAELASCLCYSEVDMRHHNWIAVGTAEITVTLKPRDEMTVETIAALRKAQSLLLAKAQAESNRIDGEISKLLAICNEVTA
jgi:hypothetical protein